MNNSRPHPRSAEGERTRLEILRVAMQLFAENGYSKTTITQIADRAHTYRSSVDWHFGSKEGLLVAVIDHFLDEQIPDSIQEVYQEYQAEHPGMDSSDVVTAFYFELLKRILARHFVSIMTLFRITFEEIPNNPDLGKKILSFWTRVSDTIAEFITLSQQSGKVSSQVNAKWTSRGILALAQGLFMQWYLERDNLDVQASVATLVSGVMRLLLLDPDDLLKRPNDWQQTIAKGE